MWPFFVAFWIWKYFFWISLAIPRPSPSGIHWPINCSQKIDNSVYFQQQQKMQNGREEMGLFSFVNCPNFVIIFCQVLKMEIIFLDIPSNPPPITVPNSLTNHIFQKNYRFCISSKKKKIGQVYIGISILVIPDHMLFSPVMYPPALPTYIVMH